MRQTVEVCVNRCSSDQIRLGVNLIYAQLIYVAGIRRWSTNGGGGCSTYLSLKYAS